MHTKIKIIFVLFLFLIIIFQIIFKNIIKNIPISKICLCTYGKKENRYIREFVQHYKYYGVDKIFLYDNNDIEGERFEQKISDYIKNHYVEIINYRGQKLRTIMKIYNHCYFTNKDNYDWLIFYEIDEFIFLRNFRKIKIYLNQLKFKNCELILLNWVHLSDNNLIYYENKPLSIRFRKRGENVKKNNRLAFVKSIIRGHLKNITLTNGHILSNKIKGCDGFGRIFNLNSITNKRPDYEYYFINHYYCKSLEEFVDKLKRGDIYKGNSIVNNMYQIKKYFYINKITSKKLDFIEKKLGKLVNLSEYRKKIQNLKSLKR